MKVEVKKSGETSVVSVEGRLDTLSAPDIEQQFNRWIDEGETRFVVDLSGLEYISSAGLRVLLAAGKKVKAKGGELSCCGLKGVVKRVFDVSGFASLLPVFETVDAALER